MSINMHVEATENSNREDVPLYPWFFILNFASVNFLIFYLVDCYAALIVGLFFRVHCLSKRVASFKFLNFCKISRKVSVWIMSRSVYDVQRDFALSSGLRSEIIWDALSPDQYGVLKEKIRTIIPDNDKTQGAVEKVRQDLFNNIWSQRKYTNRTLISATIYILVAQENGISKEMPHLARHSASFSVHPVFRTRKCMNSNNSAGCCMIFIDETGRIYSNWSNYLKNNVLPSGIMVAPLNGVYTFDVNDEVRLEYLPTPASTISAQILKSSDNIATVGGVIATVPIVTALALPVAAPVLAAATAVTAATTAYCTLRSIMHLTDRSKHGQSLAVTDRAARNSWIGVAGGVVGLGASGATKALASASEAGKRITLTTKLAINGVNVSSVLLSGTGVVSGVYDLIMKIKDDEQLTHLDVLQLASSLLIFTHSINNLRIAARVATYSEGSSVRGEYLTQIRNTLTKMVRRTSGVRGDTLRPLNEIPIKDVLLNLHKIYSKLGSSTSEATASTYIPQLLVHLGANSGRINIQYLAEEFGCKFVQHIANTGSLVDVLDSMARYLSENSFRLLINLAKIFVEEYSEVTDAALNVFMSTETVLFKMLMHCIKQYYHLSYTYLEKKTGEILFHVEEYYRSLNPVGTDGVQRYCKDCDGIYYIYNL